MGATRKLFQPLLWALVGAAVAGGIFLLLRWPSGGSITIVVPSPTPTISLAGAPSVTTRTPERQLVNINTASAELLDTLPGIGEVKAKAIVDYRNQHGLFQRIDEIMKVPGIGPGIYEGLRGLISVGEPP